MPDPKALYLCFSTAMDPERAKEIFHHRFGIDPKHTFVQAGLLKLGPTPKEKAT